MASCLPPVSTTVAPHPPPPTLPLLPASVEPERYDRYNLFNPVVRCPKGDLVRLGSDGDGEVCGGQGKPNDTALPFLHQP